MLGIGIQTQNVVYDDDPYEGYEMLRSTGFTYCDFSLNGYLKNYDIYESNLNLFFEQSKEELKNYFSEHKKAAFEAGITIHQMHMPYPIYVPKADKLVNEYLMENVASKSIEICHFLDCHYIVVHGFKLSRHLGSEELEWLGTEKFIESIAPQAKKYGITICIENLYDSIAGHIMEGPGCDVWKAVKRIDDFNERYGAEVLGFCFDTGHANLVGLDFEKFLTRLGPRVKVLHIHDNDGVGDLHQIPYTFTKTRENIPSTDWNGLIRGLRAIGFNGVLNFETAPVLTSFPASMKRRVLEFIAEIGKYWEKEIMSKNPESLI